MDELKDLKESAKISEEQGSNSFMEPEIKQPKRKQGRPKGSTKDKSGPSVSGESANPKSDPKQEKPQFNIPTKALCYPVGQALSSVAVNYVGHTKAAMSPEELESFADALGMVLDKYLPDALSKYGPEMMLGFALTQWSVRLVAMKKYLKMEEERRKADSNQRPKDEPIANTLSGLAPHEFGAHS